nr:hypothetical protein [Tanacetum cinerariifolium]
RSRWRHADIPEAEAAGIILHRGRSAAGEHADRPRRIGDVRQRARRHFAAGEHVRAHDGAQPVEIGLDPGDRRVVERVLDRRHRGVAGGRGDDQLGEHRIVPSGYLG